MGRQESVHPNLLVKPAVDSAAHHAVVPVAGNLLKVPEGRGQYIGVHLFGPNNAAALEIAIRVVAADTNVEPI